jgi:hypothetical protein
MEQGKSFVPVFEHAACSKADPTERTQALLA